ncbi:MAG TPA: hypothetical protein VMM76_20525 [Pirellulaceae bacterium]|nr:hypothetical protein [Pirellulaceae bacterium]
MTRLLVCVLCVFGVLSSLGCGDSSGPTRQALRGSITINGEVLEQGAISLRPTEGHSAPAAVTTVEQGEYRFTSDNGPLPGPYAVKINIDPDSDQGKAIIRGVAATTGIEPVELGPKGGSLAPPPRIRRPPAQPKLHWELQYTVSEDATHKDFELSP